MKPTLPAHVSHDCKRDGILLTLNVREEALVLWGVGNETLDGSSHHGVLAHQDNGIASERLSDFVPGDRQSNPTLAHAATDIC